MVRWTKSPKELEPIVLPTSGCQPVGEFQSRVALVEFTVPLNGTFRSLGVSTILVAVFFTVIGKVFEEEEL